MLLILLASVIFSIHVLGCSANGHTEESGQKKESLGQSKNENEQKNVSKEKLQTIHQNPNEQERTNFENTIDAIQKVYAAPTRKYVDITGKRHKCLGSIKGTCKICEEPLLEVLRHVREGDLSFNSLTNIEVAEVHRLADKILREDGGRWTKLKWLNFGYWDVEMSGDKAHIYVWKLNDHGADLKRKLLPSKTHMKDDKVEESASKKAAGMEHKLDLDEEAMINNGENLNDEENEIDYQDEDKDEDLGSSQLSSWSEGALDYTGVLTHYDEQAEYEDFQRYR